MVGIPPARWVGVCWNVVAPVARTGMGCLSVVALSGFGQSGNSLSDCPLPVARMLCGLLLWGTLVVITSQLLLSTSPRSGVSTRSVFCFGMGCLLGYTSVAVITS